METVKQEEDVVYGLRGTKPKSEPRMRWSCVMPIRLVAAIQRYSEETGIPQSTIVRRATEKALQEVGAL